MKEKVKRRVNACWFQIAGNRIQVPRMAEASSLSLYLSSRLSARALLFFFLMAEICYGVMSNGKGSTQCQGSSRRARRRRMDIRRFKFVTGVVPSSPLETEESSKRHKIEVHTASLPASRGDDGEDPVVENQYKRIVLKVENGKSENKEIVISSKSLNLMLSPSLLLSPIDLDSYPRYGIASVRGARRHMEDAVAIYPSFCSNDRTELHYFGVYDGHGCSHVCHHLCLS